MPNECGNPLLRDWVKEWMDQAQAIQSKAYFTYRKAYDSLCKCPVPFSHPSEAIKLDGIGEGMVKRLTSNMKKYCQDNNLPMPEYPMSKKRKTSPNDTQDALEGNSRPRAKRAPKPYVPAYRTGGYAIMLALLDFHQVGQPSVTKEQICRIAQAHCDASLTLADPGKSYTAFSSIKTLCEKGYVWKNGKPARFQLTETGISLAERLKSTNIDKQGRVSQSSAPSLNNNLGEEEENDEPEVDLSLYVTNPSQYTSTQNPSTARSNARKRKEMEDMALLGLDTTFDLTTPSSPTPLSSSVANTTNPTDDIMAALAMGNASTTKRKGKAKASRSTTVDYLDRLLERMDESEMDQPDMSLYVLNPSKHSTISLNGKTTTNTAPKRTPPSAISSKTLNQTTTSITARSNSSFAKQVMAATDDNDFSSISTSSKSKRHFNVDEFDIDLTSTQSSLPRLQSTQKQAEVVDLLSSPELSPQLQPEPSLIQPEPLMFDREDYFPLSQSRTKKVINETFQYTYLDSDRQPVRHASQALVDLDEGCMAYLVQFSKKQASHPKAQSIHKQRVDGDYVTGFLSEKDIDAVCPGLPATPILSLHREDEDTFWPKSDNYNQPLASPSSPSLSLSQPFSVSSQTPSALPDLSQTPLTNPSPSLPNSALSSSSQQSTDIESQAFFPSASQQSSEPQPDYVAMLARESIDVLLPDQYEIVLVIDSREIQMKGKRDYFEQTLTAKGVSCITRSLDLGDAIWIARSKSNPPQELFLDYIVERKRLDDLVSSIKDGRFTEQKLRLKRSGAEKLIYVVEEYNREEAERFGAQAIQTAMSSTQIIDGIFLKRTSSIDDTIDYLVSITRLIERIYRNTRLYIIPSHLITRQNYLGLKGACPRRQGEIAYVITYTLYNQLNAKNGSASLHEVYLRMLMTIRGVNAERALSLMKIYPTPRSLLEAFRGLSPDKAKVLAKNATKNHILRRRWGIQISERLYSIWGALEYASSDTNPQDDEDY
ncbi:Crossover junction endonuclease MUS81 [Choanephora cucurbitarum]|uniref:Crossover junction endonuclease MUS81 n=1 Tax=Choanephora cucurbitarum TaxID=101091 RepID=A0A1C7NCE9_9FUNG|nr:Crossover junction endonuclease MUS81 [Choanephora cucurbitarum]